VFYKAHFLLRLLTTAGMAKPKAQFRQPMASEQLMLEHLQLRRLGETSESARCDTSIVEDHYWRSSAASRWACMSSTRSVAPWRRAAAQSFAGEAEAFSIESAEPMFTGPY
jgi:hypothetical protein